jgi:16S rRNA (uracil1498-N3)-methyltransferase
MAPRFYLDAGLTVGTTAELPADAAHHALRVLRLTAGDVVVLFNGRGGEACGALQVDGPRAAVRIERCNAVERESPLAVTLVQAWIATDKLEWVMEKAVELGVARLIFVPAARSVVRLDSTRRERRMARLAQLVIAACSQCGRNRLPLLSSADSLAAGLAAAGDAPLRWLLDPVAPDSTTLDAAAARSVALAVGPEGGWTDDERAVATGAGWRAARLGPRILRTETAGLAALAALQARYGDLR